MRECDIKSLWTQIKNGLEQAKIECECKNSHSLEKTLQVLHEYASILKEEERQSLSLTPAKASIN